MALSFEAVHRRATATGSEIYSRSREVISPSGGIMRCKFPSRKNGRLVHCEGLLELDAAYAFELHPRIVRYREQPTEIDFADGPRIRRYTPDFEITLSSGEKILIEVKPAASMSRPDVQHRLQCVSDCMRRHRKPFVILSDDVLRQEPRRVNLRQIFHSLGRPFPTQAAALNALRYCRDAFPGRLSHASAALALRGMRVHDLLFMGLLRCDLNTPLTANSSVLISEEGDHDWFRLSQEHRF